MPTFKINTQYVTISKEFIEEHMPKANAEFVKVYLYALNFAHSGTAFEYLDIAKALNLLESDVIHAFQYWQEQGLLDEANGIINISSSLASPKKTVVSDKKEGTKKTNTRPEYSQNYVASTIAENSELSEMVSLAQEILGKTLNPGDIETLFWFYEGLKFPPEVILMLLEYCVSKEKRRMSYIEKVAISWHERGIASIDSANEYIQKQAEKNGFIYSIRKLLGISDRALSQTEEQYINRWHDMYKMEEDMISLCYEQCIIQTAKLSFPYMEKILERWYKEGIHTPEQAEADNRSFRSSKPSQRPTEKYEVYTDDYDHEALEQLTRDKYE